MGEVDSLKLISKYIVSSKLSAAHAVSGRGLIEHSTVSQDCFLESTPLKLATLESMTRRGGSKSIHLPPVFFKVD